MPRKQARFDQSVSQWLEAEGLVGSSNPEPDPSAIADVARVRELLVAAAREGQDVSYSEMLGALGFRFTRPKMRALCKTLDAIDQAAVTNNEPELAALVVRESDRLPGQGWWTGMADRIGYEGEWEGAEAKAFIAQMQSRAFEYWKPG